MSHFECLQRAGYPDNKQDRGRSSTRLLLDSFIVDLVRIFSRFLLVCLWGKVSRHNTKNANVAPAHAATILLCLITLLEYKSSRILLHGLLVKVEDAVISIEEHAIADCSAQKARVRDNGNDFFRARVQIAETCLATGDNGLFGKSIGVLGPVCRLIWERGVDDGKVVLGELFGDDVEWGACVAGLVCVFLPVCVGEDYN